MSGAVLPPEFRLGLAAFIEEMRPDVVAAVTRAPAVRGAARASLVAVAFLARLEAELTSGDGRALDAWAAAGSARGDRHARARVVAVTTAIVAARFASVATPCDAVASYLALRSDAVARRLVATPRTATPAARESDVVAALLAAVEARDAPTCDHSRAVGTWCARLANAVGCSAGDRAVAALAGTLHDVGKIATPNEILLKAGGLTADEWERMREHAAAGARLLERIPSLRDLAPIVRAHHERIDGTGYPDRLAGDAIPFAARIVAVADSFHAMISTRPYRRPLSIARALAELRAGAGTQWDASLVRAMLALVQPATARRGSRRAVASE